MVRIMSVLEELVCGAMRICVLDQTAFHEYLRLEMHRNYVFKPDYMAEVN